MNTPRNALMSSPRKEDLRCTALHDVEFSRCDHGNQLYMQPSTRLESGRRKHHGRTSRTTSNPNSHPISHYQSRYSVHRTEYVQLAKTSLKLESNASRPSHPHLIQHRFYFKPQCHDTQPDPCPLFINQTRSSLSVAAGPAGTIFRLGS